MKDAGGEVVGVGKISDIFATRGVTRSTRANGLEALFDATLAELKQAGEQTIIFTNFVNFDADYGHRRNVSGYAAALEYFDQRLAEILGLLQSDTELITEYHVKNLIRVGTCGSVNKDIKLLDVVIGMGACTDSKVNRIRFNNHDFAAIASYELLHKAVESTKASACCGSQSREYFLC